MLPRVPRELRISFAKNLCGVLAADVLSDLAPEEYDAALESIMKVFAEYRPVEAPEPAPGDSEREAAPQPASC